MSPRVGLLLPVLGMLGVAAWGLTSGSWWPVLPAVTGMVGVVLAWIGLQPQVSNGTRTVALMADPRLLERKRHSITEELAVLEDAQELQRGVFEVSAELVGCVDEVDARNRFAAAEISRQRAGGRVCGRQNGFCVEDQLSRPGPVPGISTQ